MADCTNLITAGFTIDCDALPIGGLESDIVLINRADVDVDAVTFDASNRIKMTNLQLKAGKTGYGVAGVKQSNGKLYSLVVKENTYDKFTHGIRFTIFNPSAALKLQLQNMVGGSFVAVVNQKWKGVDNADAFEVLGYDAGLKLSVGTNNSNANDNSILVELASEANFEERNVPYTLLETDYATTLTAFGNKFIEA